MPSSLIPLHPRDRLKRMDVGQGVLLTRVEGDTERLNILLLTIVEDTLSKWAKAWLHPKGLMVAVLAPLLSVSLKWKAVGHRGLQRTKVSHTWVIEVYMIRDVLWPKLRDAVPTIPVNLGWGMRPIP